MAAKPTTLVLDIGKTNVKLLVINKAGRILDVRRKSNASLDRPPYLQLDVDSVWDWLLDAAAALAQERAIDAVSITTHGCAGVLVDDKELVLPPIDYEAEPPEPIKEAFADLTPPFDQTHTPRLPASQNLGGQLFWQQLEFPEEFERVQWVLTYPQYWAWRLSGVAVSEITSLACHSHLWEPANGRFSSLIDRMGWRTLFPPLKPAFEALGPIKAEIAAVTGLSPDCQIYSGIHDSNSAYSLYLRGHDRPFSLASTGTWVVMFSPRMDLTRLNMDRDTLALANVRGEPLPTARFMGGREFDRLTDGIQEKRFSEADLASVIEKRAFVLPSHAEAGPFPQRIGGTAGPELADSGEILARATLYTALMTQTSMTMLKSDGDLMIDGGFVNNTYYCRLLASLLDHDRCYVNHDTEGTAVGAGMLTVWNEESYESPLRLTPAEPFEHPALDDYAADWHDRVSNQT